MLLVDVGVVGIVGVGIVSVGIGGVGIVVWTVGYRAVQSLSRLV